MVARVLPYWYDVIVPDLLAEGARGAAPCWWWPTATACGPCASTSTASSDEEITGLDIPTGIPFLYQLGDDLSVASSGYLGDPAAAAAAAEAVSRQAG